jgi:hypothetical protein
MSIQTQSYVSEFEAELAIERFPLSWKEDDIGFNKLISVSLWLHHPAFAR